MSPPTLQISSRARAQKRDLLHGALKGYYEPKNHTMRIFPGDHWTGEDAFQVMAHELGHAVALNLKTPQQLCKWATSQETWKYLSQDCSELRSHLDPFFFQPHPYKVAPKHFLQEKLGTISRYALSNIQEFFAESFASQMRTTH